LTNSSWQDALRVTIIERPKSRRGQCLSSGRAKVSWNEQRVTRRCVVGDESSGS